MRMQTCRWIVSLDVFKVPTIGSHTGSQALGEACHSLVDRRRWSEAPPSARRWSLALAVACGTSPASHPRRGSRAGSGLASSVATRSC